MPFMPSSLPKNINEGSRSTSSPLEIAIQYITTGFFKPYSGMGDFGKSLADPVILPISGAIDIAFSAVAAAASAIFAAGSLIFSAGAALFGNKKFAKNCLETTQMSLVFAVVAAALTVALVVLNAIIIPVALTKLVTRSVSTLVSPLIDCCSKDTDSMEEEIYPATTPLQP